MLALAIEGGGAQAGGRGFVGHFAGVEPGLTYMHCCSRHEQFGDTRNAGLMVLNAGVKLLNGVAMLLLINASRNEA